MNENMQKTIDRAVSEASSEMNKRIDAALVAYLKVGFQPDELEIVTTSGMRGMSWVTETVVRVRSYGS